ncbi:hypothetical protein ABEB36_015846 [Hypothenemus hampei]|uniref:Uncharacterized protein n=1 Tax=Hypothenemus hampei TaxID=57062 RepID=A0ABD1DYV6_HYPHA
MEYKLTARITRASPGAPCPYSPSVSALGCLCLATTNDAAPSPASRKGRRTDQHRHIAAVSPQPRQAEKMHLRTNPPAVDGMDGKSTGECGTRLTVATTSLKTLLLLQSGIKKS